MKLLCREYRAERNHPVVLVLDTGHLMGEHLDGIPRLDHAVNAALLLGYVALKTGDRVGLYSFDSGVGTYTQPQSGLRTLNVLQELTSALEYTTNQTNFTLGISALQQRLKRRSLVVVFTDFTDPVTAQLMVENLARTALRHVLVFVSLRDSALDRLGEAVPRDLDALNRAVVAQDFLQDRALVIRQLRRIGITCLDVAARDLSSRLINRYLYIKRRELV